LDARTGREVAVKLERLSVRSSQQQLVHEAKVLARLGQSPRPQGFAELLHFCEEGRYRCLVMERLGKNLEDLLQVCGGSLQPRTVVLIAEQVLHCIEFLHSKGLVHRDIKPDNFMCGLGPKQHHIHLIDFGLSNVYYDRKHVQMAKRSLTGTVRYASINTHNCMEQSRRDDLEAIAHMLVYFLRGVLPWSGLTARTMSEKCEMIRRIKISTPVSELCAGQPREFEDFLAYCRALRFSERPQYAAWLGRFRQLRAELGEKEGHVLEDYDFEWNDGVVLGRLEPLHHPGHLVQPDDREFRKRLMGLGGLCGRAKRPAEPEPVAVAAA